MGLGESQPRHSQDTEPVNGALHIGSLLKNGIFDEETGQYIKRYGIAQEIQTISIGGVFRDELINLRNLNIDENSGNGETGTSYCIGTNAEIFPFSHYGKHAISNYAAEVVPLDQDIPEGLLNKAKVESISVVIAGTMHVHHEEHPLSFSPRDVINLLGERIETRPIANVADGLATKFTHEVIIRTPFTRFLSNEEAEKMKEESDILSDLLAKTMMQRTTDYVKAGNLKKFGTKVFEQFLTVLQSNTESELDSFREIATICLEPQGTRGSLYAQVLDNFRAENNINKVLEAYTKTVEIAVSRFIANKLARENGAVIFRGHRDDLVLYRDSQKR